jgi:hypothetical protein
MGSGRVPELARCLLSGFVTLPADEGRRTLAGTGSNGDLPFAKELFEAADRMRGSVESAEYKHLVLGLLFLKYISDSFERRRAWLETETRDPASQDYFTEDDGERVGILEDRDEYTRITSSTSAPARNLIRPSWLPRRAPGLLPPDRSLADPQGRRLGPMFGSPPMRIGPFERQSRGASRTERNCV